MTAEIRANQPRNARPGLTNPWCFSQRHQRIIGSDESINEKKYVQKEDF